MTVCASIIWEDAKVFFTGLGLAGGSGAFAEALSCAKHILTCISRTAIRQTPEMSVSLVLFEIFFI
jgi:hypothetical protein